MSNPNDWFRKRMDELRASRGNRCEEIEGGIRCEATTALEWAHIKETPVNGWGRGRNRRILDIMKHTDHYKLLCKPHHLRMDGRKQSKAMEARARF